MYAMNLNLKDRICIVLGGGSVALRKILPLLESNARVEIIAPEVCEEILKLSRESRVNWIQQTFSEKILRRGTLFFAATDDPFINDRASRIARNLGMLVNNATNSSDSDFSVPATIRRKNFQIAISTGDLSPAFSRFIRKKLEIEFPIAISDFLERLHVIRKETRSKIPRVEDRIKIWREVFESRGNEILQQIQQGNIDSAEAICRNAIDMHGHQPSDSGR